MKDFTVLPVQCGDATHYMYMKEHSAKKESASRPPNRTLFIANIPSFVKVRPCGLAQVDTWQEANLQKLFSTAAPVASVSIETSEDISNVLGSLTV